MSYPKIRASLSQHWMHSAQCDCLGSCWRAVSLTDCKHAGKRFRHGPVLLRAELTQVSALTHDPDLSEKSSGKEQCVTYGFGAADATHTVASSGSMLENKAGDGGEGFECLERGRLHQTCG